jgi:DNA-directed RNA polymerase subunit A"
MSKELQKNYSDEITLPESLSKRIEEEENKRRLNKEERNKLEEEVKKTYLKEKFEPGDAFGIIAAQSISEPATQMTMRTYHFAGSAGIKITYGLPRLIEIFDARRTPETPVMTVYIKRDLNNREVAKKLAEDIVEKSVSDLVRKVSIDVSESSIEFEPYDMKRIERIARIIKENFKEMSIRIKSKRIVVSAKSEIDIKELQKIKEKIMDVHIEGVKGVSSAVVRREGEEWIINTIGSNLGDVLSVPEVDETRTITNDLYEVMKILGVEAARNLIISEALKTMQEQGLDVDVRHVMLVGDIMTFTGDVQSIGRYGVAGGKSSILARAAFEETIKHLVKASLRNEKDSFQGIFENVMIGQVVPSGTGMFDLVAKFSEEEK